jgi:hypothetical protein
MQMWLCDSIVFDGKCANRRSGGSHCVVCDYGLAQYLLWLMIYVSDSCLLQMILPGGAEVELSICFKATLVPCRLDRE